MRTFFNNDIPLQLAVSAFYNTSFHPERRGAAFIAEYAEQLAGDFEYLSKHAEQGGTQAIFEGEFEKYRVGYKKRCVAYLTSSARCVSSMIVGPARFPADRMNKRADIAHRRLNEIVQFREAAIKSAMRNLRPDLRPIMSGDDDAVERLQREIDEKEALQEHMKRANALIRKYQDYGEDAQIGALTAIGLREESARKLLAPAFWGVGYPPFRLKNNGANIRQMQIRLEKIKKYKAQPVYKTTSPAGIGVEDDPPANRIRLFYPDKPDYQTRETLKSKGFRWTPTLSAWQAYRNDKSMDFARSILKG